jgi:hypothetical protein
LAKNEILSAEYVANVSMIASKSPESSPTDLGLHDALSEQTIGFQGPWDSNILSPSSRTVSPVTIHRPHPDTLYSYPHEIDLSATSPVVIYDFGKEVGGITTLDYTSDGIGKLGLAFSETKTWTGPASDGSNGSYHSGGDGALITHLNATSNGLLRIPDRKQRGGKEENYSYSLPISHIFVNRIGIHTLGCSC